MNNPDKQNQLDWWLGLADMLAEGTGHGVQKLERVHLSIADESFHVLEAIPITRPWARVVKSSHHGIARVCYGVVKLGARSVSAATAAMVKKDQTGQS
ncbi:hypothetical protein LPB19_02830 [Marinobacter salinisoli]|uniref:Uncharacterized protein n=1 Tax=Marinobacter salinisoli TaxID=2769486 RepID=A0ABX7MYV2_9GAMM|nr:hypothetical protein [Marinobacter salinisoli]QSP95373.1 hypothetical protein LPB19_02830 [Marinobacter salinisoli]